MQIFHSVDYRNVSILGGFWKNRQSINAETTAYSVYNRFSDSHRFEALDCNWKEGMSYTPHIFWDSDIAKWIEGAAYILQKREDPTLEQLCEKVIDTIIQNQDSDGYFNSYYLVMHQDERFKHRTNHELYCAGHLFEAACAYYEATGKDRFLSAMCKYADYIYDTFYIYQTASFTTCGHPEIELALIRLYETTGNPKYLTLSKFFIDKHGNNQKDLPPTYSCSCNEYYVQDHLPLKEQSTAEGHCVRALYLYSAMADIAREYQDEEYLDACLKILDNILNRRMYITGGVGSTHIGEAFTTDHYLPNDVAYTETCAAISLAFFCRRLQTTTIDSRLADTIERIIYNGFLSGVSLDGKSFFYENPLEIDPNFFSVNTSTNTKRHVPIMERLELFNCSCCPPNVLRFIASIGNFLYTYKEDTLFIHQYMESQAKIQDAVISQETAYPVNGSVKIKITGNAFREIALRIPAWCPSFTASAPYRIEHGYAYFTNVSEISLDFSMPVTLYESNAAVQNNAGCVAVARGPVLYCLEESDNGKHLRSLLLPSESSFETVAAPHYQVPILKTTGLRKTGSSALYQPYQKSFEQTPLTFIPYFAFANRGANEMLVWVHVSN